MWLCEVTKNTASLLLHEMFCLWWCLSSQMSSFGSCLGSDCGIPLNKHALFFQTKACFTEKSTRHYSTWTILISLINVQLRPHSVCLVRHYTFIRNIQFVRHYLSSEKKILLFCLWQEVFWGDPLLWKTITAPSNDSCPVVWEAEIPGTRNKMQIMAYNSQFCTFTMYNVLH